MAAQPTVHGTASRGGRASLLCVHICMAGPPVKVLSAEPSWATAFRAAAASSSSMAARTCPKLVHSVDLLREPCGPWHRRCSWRPLHRSICSLLKLHRWLRHEGSSSIGNARSCAARVLQQSTLEVARTRARPTYKNVDAEATEDDTSQNLLDHNAKYRIVRQHCISAKCQMCSMWLTAEKRLRWFLKMNEPQTWSYSLLALSSTSCCSILAARAK